MRHDSRFLCGLTATLVLFLTVSCSCGGRENVRRDTVNLNKVLTNALSDTADLKGMERKIRSFMQEWQLKGASFAVMRGDSLYYAKGFGWADEGKKEEMGPGHIMRIASVSKLITATGIMLLQEQGKLSIKDKVFGPEGLLRDSTYLQSISDRNYYRITVEDLLRHKGGLTTTGGDPMFSTRSIMANNKLKEAPDHQTLLRLVLRRKLGFLPGTSQSYSNLGYLLLSMIIEEVTGESYEDWIQENILRPAGCRDMHIAHNYYKDKYKNEVRNYVPSNEPTQGRTLLWRQRHPGPGRSRRLGGFRARTRPVRRIDRRQARDLGHPDAGKHRRHDRVFRQGHLLLWLERHQPGRRLDPKRHVLRHFRAHQVFPGRRMLGLPDQHQHLERSRFLPHHGHAFQRLAPRLG